MLIPTGGRSAGESRKMAAIKTYDVYIAGSEKIDTVHATCITKACKKFMETLEKQAKYKRVTSDYATISYIDNYSICSDFVVMEQ